MTKRDICRITVMISISPSLTPPCSTHRLLHGKQGDDLQQVVLDHIADDPILVKVPASALSAKVLAKDDLCVRERVERQEMRV